MTNGLYSKGQRHGAFVQNEARFSSASFWLLLVTLARLLPNTTTSVVSYAREVVTQHHYVCC